MQETLSSITLRILPGDLERLTRIARSLPGCPTRGALARDILLSGILRCEQELSTSPSKMDFAKSASLRKAPSQA